MPTLSDPLRLPCGLELPNRVIKAAMTEGLAERGNDPGTRLERLYGTWASGEPGLILTGNVMVERRSLERARNVVVDSETDAAALRRWAASTGSTPAIVQLSHPGRQVTRLVNPKPVAPSAIGAVGIAGAFAAPRELGSDEIAEIRDRFVDAGRRCLEAGFDGVQLHAAHGYLISAFLSPQQNTRTDRWGGDLEGRARLVVETVAKSRAELGERAVIAVKLNVSDDGSGDGEESAQVARWIADAGCDLIEVSGGTYETPAMLSDVDGGEGAEEAFFLRQTRVISDAVDIPVALTGGLRTRAGAEAVLESGAADAIGLARSLAVEPKLAERIVGGEVEELPRPAPRLGGPKYVQQTFGAASNSGWHRWQLARFADGKDPQLGLPAAVAVADYMMVDGFHAIRERRARFAKAGRTEQA